MALAITLAVLAGLALLYWAVQTVGALLVIRSVKRIADLPERELPRWPRVSVVITARDEERRLAEGMTARLADDYPDLELILVEDRSTDRTPAIADRIAAADPRVKVIHLRELPPGWLGKLNALRVGAEAATGEYLLFSDGDVFVQRGALRRVVAHAEALGLGHLAVLPEFYSSGLLLDAATAAFLRAVAVLGRLWKVDDPRSSAGAGSGSFNLVRQSALSRSKGFEHLRMELADDAALGKMLKLEGNRSAVLNGKGFVGVFFYETLAGLARGTDRAGWTVIGGFSLLRLSLIALLSTFLELSPLLALLPWGPSWLRWVGLLLLLLSYGSTVALALWLGRLNAGLLLWPLSALVSMVLYVRAGILGRWRGGILWRGTFYSDAELRAGRRFDLR